VPDEARFDPRGEEARAHRMIGAIGREDEGGLGVVELAGDGEHLRLGEPIGVQHHPGRVAREGLAGKGIDLVNLNLPRHPLYHSRSLRARRGRLSGARRRGG
jgi:hypothetical protein